MKFSLVTLSIAALCLLQQIQAAPPRYNRRGDDGVIGNGIGSDTQLLNDNHVLNVLSKTDSQGHGSGNHNHEDGEGVIGNGVLSGDRILSDNHLLNIGSHTESKRGEGEGVIGNGVVSGDKILDSNHVLNIFSHTESKRDGGEGIIGNGVVSGDKILDSNHVLNIFSHTESKRDGGEGVIGNGIVSGDNILDSNHLLNIGSHTESKRAILRRDDGALLGKLLDDSTLSDLVGGPDSGCDGAILDDKTKDRLQELVKDLLAKDDGLKPVLGDLFAAAHGLLGELNADDVLDLSHIVARDTVDSKLDAVIGLLHRLLELANADNQEQVTEVAKIVTGVVKSALCAAP